jgi:plasmid stabilization system protein ParE
MDARAGNKGVDIVGHQDLAFVELARRNAGLAFITQWRVVMPRGDKSKYTDKQERKADHIAESYESRGVPEKEAERRAWATVNRESGGGKKSGSGRGKTESNASSGKGGKLGGRASASRSAAARSASAKKAAATRKRNAEQRRAAR